MINDENPSRELHTRIPIFIGISSSTVIVRGLAEAAAGALAMGRGSFLANQAENQLFKTEIADEEAETVVILKRTFQHPVSSILCDILNLPLVKASKQLYVRG